MNMLDKIMAYGYNGYMDKSDMYVLMCDCEEIQGMRPDLQYVNQESNYNYWMWNTDQIASERLLDNGKYFSGGHTSMGDTYACRGIYTPNQDDLINLMFKRGQRCFHALEVLWNFWTHPDRQLAYCDTLEKLWLALYMPILLQIQHKPV